ncbi:TonB-dependent receptor plug domain-containing protein [Altererythrobacter soli]|uniref:TonB-dependent receptor plug domain-containing protein n=1 Tax=Croceibacterium soli TaxID=1739690 RepID=A0A6I4UVG5_9SPHN|nr:TonB-dependent receptor plug domain-containing protein [Croceibacterium soli]MXP41779.1 TonB-dependent receptor plug domain-containing protein [Croceibacterium soli]
MRRTTGWSSATACALALAAAGAVPAAARNGANAEDQASPPADAAITGDAPPPAPTAVAEPAASAAGGERQVYTPADFARYAPRTALDMLRNVPGFSIEGGAGPAPGAAQRGIGQASGNVLVNGERLSSKSTSVSDQLVRIAAGDVTRIEIVDGSTLNIPGLSGRVANVIATRTGGIAGRFEWRPQASTGPAPLRWSQGDVSVSGTTGPTAWTLSLRNDSFYGGSAGPNLITFPPGVVEFRRNETRSKIDVPKLGASLRFDLGETQANLNLSYGRRWFNSREDEARTDRALTPLSRALRTRDRGYDYEIGGDIEFLIGGGRLKLIGLESFETIDFSTQSVLSIADGRPALGSRFTRSSDEGERVGRAEYRRAMLGGDWQWSVEAAFNRLDNVGALFFLNPAGSFVEVPFPAATGGVREDRYESILSYGRPLTDKVTLQLAAGAEHSTIAQSGANALSRSFLRPKGSLNLAWAAAEGFDVSMEFARRVGQLNFADFLAAVNLSQDNTDAGNNQLRPPQSWEFELEMSRNFGAWGSASVKLFHDWIQDYVTVIPVLGGGESSGNVPSAKRRGYSVQGTWQMDSIGFAGAKTDLNLHIEESTLKDPVTRARRAFDRTRLKEIRLDFRHDVPRTDLAWGTEFRRSIFAPYYRVSEFGYDYNVPTFGAVFAEHKDVMGLTVRARVGNLFKGGSVLHRAIYAGPRDRAPILFRENRRRGVGYVFNLNVSGSF